MAWATLYDGEFVDKFGVTTSVTIEGDDADDTGDLVFAGRPLVFHVNDDNPDVPWGIHRTNVDIRLVGGDDLHDELRISPVKTYRAVIDGPVSGTYWLDSWRMRSQVAAPSVNVIRAFDGIDLLKTELWYADEDAAIAVGRVSFKDALVRIINQIGLGLPFRTQHFWYANNTGITTSKDPLAEYDFDAGWLYRKLQRDAGGSDNRTRTVYSYDVLMHLLMRWQLKLAQVNGIWYIHHPISDDEQKHWRYDSSGTFDSYETTGLGLSLHAGVKYHKLGDGYELGGGPSYERVETVFDYDTVGELIRDPSYTSIFSDGNERWGISAGSSVTLVGGGAYGTVDARIARINEVSNNSTTTISLTQARSDVASDAIYIQSDWSETAVEAQTTNYIEFSIGAQLLLLATGTWYGPDNHWAFYTIEATSEDIAGQTGPAGANHFYLQDDMSWATGAKILATPFTSSPYPASLSVPVSVRAALGADLSSGTRYKFRVKLYGAFDTYYKVNGDVNKIDAIDWTRPSLYFFEDDESIASERRFVTTNATALGVEVIDGIRFYLGDGPQQSNRSAIVHTDSGEATLVWGTDKGWKIGSVGTSSARIDQVWAETTLKAWGYSPPMYAGTFIQVDDDTTVAQQIKQVGWLYESNFTAGTDASGEVLRQVSSEIDVKERSLRYTGFRTLNTTTGSTTEVSDNNFVYRTYVQQPVNIEAPYIALGPVTVTTATADWWFVNANTPCRSVTYKVSTSSTWSITSGTTKIVDSLKRQAQATQETGLTADTLYYVHWKAFSASDGTGTEGAPMTGTFRTPEEPGGGGLIIVLPEEIAINTLALYDFVGELGGIANNELVPDRVGTYDLVQYSDKASYVTRGYRATYASFTSSSLWWEADGNTGSIQGIGTKYAELFNHDPLTYIIAHQTTGSSVGRGGLYIVDWGPYYIFDVTTYVVSGVATVELRVRDSVGSKYAKLTNSFDVGTDYVFYGVSYDRSTGNYTLRSMSGRGYKKLMGTLDSDIAGDWNTDTEASTMESLNGYPYDVFWMQIIDGEISDKSFRELYEVVRTVFIARDSALEEEFPSMGGGDIILTSETFTAGDTTPDVSGGSGVFYTANTSSTSITMFDGGMTNQQIYIYIADANTTIVHNTSYIITKSGSDLTAGGVYSFVLLGGKWYQV